MPYHQPDVLDFQHARWLKREVSFSGHGGVHQYCRNLAQEVLRAEGRKGRRDFLENIERAFGVILADLYQTHHRDPSKLIMVSLANGAYQQSPYNPNRLGIRAVRSVINFMKDAEPPYVESYGGNRDHQRERGYPTRIRATRRLIDELDEVILIGEGGEENPGGEIHRPITRNTLEGNHNHPDFLGIFRKEPLPLIRLKSPRDGDNGSPRFLPFAQTPETQRMTGNLNRINSFIDEHWIDLILSNEEFSRLSSFRDEEVDEFGERAEVRQDLDLLLSRELYRVFNNGDFDQGGRFYGGWWQGIPRQYRRFITINGYPTAELDYSNMQIAMLYAQVGEALNDDAYSLEGFPASHRRLLKTTLLKMINADGVIPPPRINERPDGWEWNQIQEALREKHQPIARYFNSGIGVRLQRIDSDIAERVVLAMRERGALALPIHDSFIVWEGRQDQLRTAMADAYRECVGGDVGVDADGRLFPNLPHNIDEARRLGFDAFEEYARELENVADVDRADHMARFEERREFEAYRGRRRAFVEQKVARHGQEWLRNRHFL
ncbi:hypothetical protein [Nitratireductor sp. L15S-10]|uniref:hypothetical protein n=1 Tax=Nitratireductor sp. L15S-10 TaxID=3034028 RepID=UPI003857ACA5